MTKALVIEGAGRLWGSERALLDLIDAAQVIEFAVCCPPGSPLINEFNRRQIRVFPWFVERLHKKSRWQRLVAALGVMRACLAFRPDVIHINQSGAWRVTSFAAYTLRLPVVCHVRIFEDAAYLASRHPNPQILRSIIAISGAVEHELSKFSSLRKISVNRIYDAYYFSRMKPPGYQRSGRVICVGRITAIKGQEVLLRAIAQKTEKLPFKCLMVGDGEPQYVAGLKEMSPKGVHWFGATDNVIKLLASCSVLVCPSYREPLGRVIFEAWDCGAVPVVYKGSGGAAEIVLAADGGIVYSEQTPECLADAIDKALSLSQRDADHFVANGRKWLAGNCAPDAYGPAITAVLNAAANQ